MPFLLTSFIYFIVTANWWFSGFSVHDDQQRNNIYLQRCIPNFKFPYKSSKRDKLFLDLEVSVTKCKLSTDLHIKLTHAITTYIIVWSSRAYKTVTCS